MSDVSFRMKPQSMRFTSTTASRSEEHTSELQSRPHLVCRLLLEKKKKEINYARCKNSYSHQVSVLIEREFVNDISLEINYFLTVCRLLARPLNANLSYNARTVSL